MFTKPCNIDGLIDCNSLQYFHYLFFTPSKLHQIAEENTRMELIHLNWKNESLQVRKLMMRRDSE